LGPMRPPPAQKGVIMPTEILLVVATMAVTGLLMLAVRWLL